MTSGVFGDNTGSTVLNSVTCSGNETRILDCSYLTSDSIICSDHSAAVVCQGLTIFKIYCCNVHIYLLTHFLSFVACTNSEALVFFIFETICAVRIL